MLERYVIVDVFKEIVDSVRLNPDYETGSVINYQYGYVTELITTLQNMEKDPKYYLNAFPLVWVQQPFTISRKTNNFYGTTEGLNVYIITTSGADWKAEQRMTESFKKTLYKIYDALLIEIDKHLAFSTMGVQSIPHSVTDFYWWGENQEAVLTHIVDCLKIGDLSLQVNHKNCIPFKSL